MATCKSCGKELSKFSDKVNARSYGGLCISCTQKVQLKEAGAGAGETLQALIADEENQEKVEAIILTTEAYPMGLTIKERIEVVTAECAFGMNIFKDLFAGVRNIVGGRSEAVQKTLRDTRRTALYELKKEAYEVGANAVVGVDLDYVELGATGSTMVLLVASGTAVVLDEQE